MRRCNSEFCPRGNCGLCEHCGDWFPKRFFRTKFLAADGGYMRDYGAYCRACRAAPAGYAQSPTRWMKAKARMWRFRQRYTWSCYAKLPSRKARSSAFLMWASGVWTPNRKRPKPLFPRFWQACADYDPDAWRRHFDDAR